MILGLKVERVPIVESFVQDVKLRLKRGLPVEQINLSSGIKSYPMKDNTTIIVYNYELFGEVIFKYVALLAGLILLIFSGFNFYLLFPIIFYFMPQIITFIGYQLLVKGLRRHGYEGSVKYLFPKKIVSEVVFNVSR